MAAPENGARGNGRRRSLLDLAPLERDCMLALWPLGEGTVRQIREEMAPTRPRAYTTIMTIMDRLAQKGVVTRTKAGRAYLYRPNFTAEDLRTHAVEQLVQHFFEGSRDSLRAHLSGEAPATKTAPPARSVRPPARPAPPPEPEESTPPTRLDDSLL